MANAPFPVDPALTALAISYHNEMMIADAVMPRTRVGKQEFKYFKTIYGDEFTIPDTRVGRKSRPNMVETGGTEVTDSTVDYGLEDAVPLADIQNADSRYNPLARAVTYLTNLVELDREKRVADLVTTLANYPSTQRATLSGTSQWSDWVNSNPVSAILSAMDGMVMRPNVMVIGQQVATQLIQHPKVVQSVNRTAQANGVIDLNGIASLFPGIERIVVGQAWLNTAKKGQATSYSRAWGKHCALLRVDNLADPARGSTFGFTAQWGDRIAGSEFDRDIGLRGGQRVRLGESVKEVISENTLGYFFQNAVA
jgi:hypothetical protein